MRLSVESREYEVELCGPVAMVAFSPTEGGRLGRVAHNDLGWWGTLDPARGSATTLLAPTLEDCLRRMIVAWRHGEAFTQAAELEDAEDRWREADLDERLLEEVR